MKRLVLTTALLLVASSAYCEPAGWYAGASLGRSHYQETCDGIRANGFVGSCDDVDLGWRVWVGRGLTDHVGVELGYVDFGNVKGKGVPGNFNVDSSIRGWTLHGVLSWPVNDRFTVFGKAGLIAAKVSTNRTGFSADDRDIAPGAGAGATYKMTDQLNLRAEWEFFGKVGDSSPGATGDDTVDLMSLGLEYHY